MSEKAEIVIRLSDIREAWDKVDQAIAKILVAQPHSMSQAAAELRHEQKEFREALRLAAL